MKADEGLSDDTSKTISDVIIVQNMLVARTEDSDIAQSEFSTSRYDLYATIPSEEQFYTDVNEIYKSVLNRDSISPTEYTFNSRSQLPAGTPWWLEFLPYLAQAWAAGTMNANKRSTSCWWKWTASSTTKASL